jgi:hypothetical protein
VPHKNDNDRIDLSLGGCGKTSDKLIVSCFTGRLHVSRCSESVTLNVEQNLERNLLTEFMSFTET